MSKIERFQGDVKAFASNAQGLERTVFGGTTQANDLTSQVTAAFLRGWGIVGPSEHPSLEDFNAAMYAMSQFIAYQHQMGIPEWHEAQEYYIGSICTHSGESYQSLEDGNIGNEPPSSNWTPVLTSKNGLSNLQLGEAAKRDVGTTVGTVAAGDDLRITGALQKANNLYELTNKSDARANLGLGTVATKNVGNSAGQIPDMSYWSSPSGGINFPNGFQMRFGTIAGGGGKVFSTPFTNQCYGIVFGQTYASSYWIFSPMYRASDLSKTGFAFINTAWSGVPGTASQDAGESVFYLAVGY